MVIYIKSDGTTQVVSPEHIYQGSSVNTITLLTPFPSTVAMQVGFRLPDGSIESYKPMQYVDTVINGATVSAYTYQLTAAITAQVGTVGIAFCALFSNGKQTSYLANIEVEKSILPTLPPAPTDDVYDLILKYMQENAADIDEIYKDLYVISGKVNSAYNIASQARNTANDAMDIAEEALAQSKVTGTQVEIAGVFTPKLDFTSNPQTQIDDKTQVNVGGVQQRVVDFASNPQTQIDNLSNEITQVDSNAKADIAAVDKKADTAIDAANEAKDIAEEALEQSKVTGTQVQVNGVFQQTLDFTSNPQEQLDNKLDKSGGTVDSFELSGKILLNNGNESSYIELGKTGNTGLEFHAQPNPNVFLDYDAYIQATDANSTTSYGSAILKYVARRHDFSNEILNMYGQVVRGFKGITIGNSLSGEKTGFYNDAYNQYSKYIAVGDGGDKLCIGWEYGGDNANRLHVRIYNSGNTQFHGLALLIDPTTNFYEPSTANGWTIGGTDLAPPVDGVYVLSAKTSLGWLQPIGFSFGRYGIATQAGLLNVSIQYIAGWSVRALSDNSTTTITQVAYKKII